MNLCDLQIVLLTLSVGLSQLNEEGRAMLSAVRGCGYVSVFA